MKNQDLNIEVYSKKWCPYCRKAKAFLKAKGLSFIEHDVDEGDKFKEMEKRTGRKTVPQIFVSSKHLGGYDDLIELERSGRLNSLLGIPERSYSQKLWELIIIGGGPAGINAALYAARKGIKVLLITRDIGGQVIDTEGIENYLGIKDATGASLVDAFWQHAREYNIASVFGEKVEGIKKAQDIYILKTDNNREYRSRTVIIASGTRKRRLGMKEEYVLSGKGVHYCAICDGYQYEGKPVAVVGGGNSGLEAALDLAKLDCEVSLIEIQRELMGDKYLQERINKTEKIKVYTSNRIEKIIGEERLESIYIKDNNDREEELMVAALFIEIGLIANSDFAKNLLEINNTKEIVINTNNETNIKGIWAAGDVTDIKDKQIIISAAEGAKAALRVNEYLK